MTCSSVVATSVAASSNCKADIQITLNYGGFMSNPFLVTIVEPSTITLSANYPKHFSVAAGYNSDWRWDLKDTCGNLAPGLHGYESFGTFAPNITNENNPQHPLPPLQAHLAGESGPQFSLILHEKRVEPDHAGT